METFRKGENVTCRGKMPINSLITQQQAFSLSPGVTSSKCDFVCSKSKNIDILRLWWLPVSAAVAYTKYLLLDPVDVDECREENPCGPNAACANVPGSYQCVCNPGFVLKSGRRTFSGNQERCEGKGCDMKLTKEIIEYVCKRLKGDIIFTLIHGGVIYLISIYNWLF